MDLFIKTFSGCVGIVSRARRSARRGRPCHDSNGAIRTESNHERSHWIALCFALCTGGCSGPDSQLTQCQQDKDQLLATIREQRDAEPLARRAGGLARNAARSVGEGAGPRLDRPAACSLSSKPVEEVEAAVASRAVEECRSVRQVGSPATELRPRRPSTCDGRSLASGGTRPAADATTRSPAWPSSNCRLPLKTTGRRSRPRASANSTKWPNCSSPMMPRDLRSS